jgi:hypothetical protein
VQANAEDRAISNENSKSRAFSICNASGPAAANFNGQYFPNPSADSLGRVVYCKRDEPSACIEHRAGMWQLKPMLHMGTDECIADVPGGCALDECDHHDWKLNDDKQTPVHIQMFPFPNATSK